MLVCSVFMFVLVKVVLIVRLENYGIRTLAEEGPLQHRDFP